MQLHPVFVCMSTCLHGTGLSMSPALQGWLRLSVYLSPLLQLGSDQTVAELKAVEEYANKYGHCSVVTKPDWLRECLRERQLLHVSQELTVSPQDLAELISQQAAAAQAAAVAPPAQVGCAIGH